MTEIRLIGKDDLAHIAEIERLCFSEPWSEASLELLLGDGNFGVTAVCDGQAVAYAGVISAPPEGEITNVATHPDYRRKGLADAVIERLKQEAERRGIDTLYLEVRRSNSAARALYEKQGFEAVGERKGFYKNPREDALLMALALGDR